MFASSKAKQRMYTGKKMVVSDESINTYGLRILSTGWKNKEQFLANPIMLFNHNRAWSNEADALPIGRWESITSEGDRIMAVPVIDDEDAGFGKAIAGKVERGVIKAASVGIRIIAISTDPLVMLPGQTEPTVTEWEMREISLVDIPANKNCVMFYDADGKEMNFSDAIKPPVSPTSTSNQQPKKKMEGQELTFVAGFLGLTSGAKLADVQDAILNLRNQNKDLAAKNSSLEAENKTFKDTAQKQRNEEIEAKLADGVASKKITIEEVPDWRNNFVNAYDSSNRIWEKMSDGKVVKLSDFVKTVVSGDADFKYKGKTFKELEKENPDALANLKASDPATFKQLFKAEYGKDWKD